MTLAAPPLFSMIVPVLNGAETLGQCLASIRSSSFSDWELIVVDDGSSDNSVEIATTAGVKVLRTAGRCGPGAARNQGAAEARGDWLFFIDADCSPAIDALARAAEILRRKPTIDALFGSYDDAPSARGLVARYKNLQHHHVHQTGNRDATTFWAGCGVIRRSVFQKLGGFDTRRYSRPCIEDIELGYRLTAAGGRIRLAGEVQVKHHKAWTLVGVVRSDLFDRGIPWTLLLLERGRADGDLNLDWQGRSGVVLAILMAAGLGLAPFWPRTLMLTTGAGLVLVWLNLGFYRLLAAKGGLTLLIGGMALHWLYQLNCAIAYVTGRFLFWRRRHQEVPPGGS